MRTSTRLAIGAAVVLGVTAYMAYVGATVSWQYYLTVDECVANPSALLNDRIRVSGTIVRNSLRVDNGQADATFMLQGTRSDLRVRCGRELPPNMNGETQVVVEGRMNESGALEADKLFTRCASKYSSQNNTASPDGPENLERQEIR